MRKPVFRQFNLNLILMTQAIISAVLTFVFGGVIGAYLQTVYAYKKEVLSNVWNKRYEQYQKIWKLSGILPRYPENRSVTYEQLYKTCIAVKDWYFEGGGMIMSTTTRATYEELQQTLFTVSQSQQLEPLSSTDHDLVRSLFSRFRSELTGDLTSRNKSLF